MYWRVLESSVDDARQERNEKLLLCRFTECTFSHDDDEKKEKYVVVVLQHNYEKHKIHK
jgi:hypothetical protein